MRLCFRPVLSFMEIITLFPCSKIPAARFRIPKTNVVNAGCYDGLDKHGEVLRNQQNARGSNNVRL